MVGVGKVWKRGFGNDAGQMKVELNLTVTRRNQIVHACDSDPIGPGTVTPLSADDVLSSIRLVESLIVEIERLL
jgi:hypothetical protein